MSKVINISNLKPGKTYKVSVRGNLSNGKKTTWSQNYTITTPSDTAPATPAVPTVSVIGPQKVLITHDNKDSTGANLSDTNKLFEVYMSSTNSNSSGTLIGTIPAQKPSSGFNTVSTIAVNGPTTDATKYFYVKAVNFSGQRSASSATTSSVAITTFDSAYIGSLTADKIATGTLQANTSISVGSSTPIVLKANATSPYGQIYIGTGTYANSNTPFYVDSSGKFSLGNQLSFSSGTLSIGIVDTAQSTANTAQSTANTAASKSQKFDTNGNIINGIKLETTGNIYSQKTTYLDNTNGWFLGWNSTGLYPVINIGNATNYVKWTESSTLEIKGNITSTSGTIGGWTIGSTSLYNNYLEFVSNDPGLGYGLIKFNSGSKTYNMVGTTGIWFVQDESANNVISYGSTNLILGNSTKGIKAGLSHSYNDFGLRNIKASTSDPVDATDGSNGDVWLKYS